MASDAIFNVTRGSVKLWKHVILGLGLTSLTGSKQIMQILNREGHCIDYNTTKGLETELAYSIEPEGRDSPDGLNLHLSLSTATVWDNNDADMETLDGKATLHITVVHTYQSALDPEDNSMSNGTPETVQFQPGRMRRKFQGKEREIPPFQKPLNKALFMSTYLATSTPEDLSSSSVYIKPLDLYWLHKSRKENIPLHDEFLSMFITDALPLHRICFMDPILSSPSNNNVVKETMV